MPASSFTRRTFIKGCGAVAALAGLASCNNLSSARRRPLAIRRLGPNDKPGIALVGCGSQGKSDAQMAASYGQIVAVCDVDESHAAAAALKFADDKGRKPAVFTDFRRILERDDIHVIVNGTPDHWHTLVNLGAARAGKDVYAEKPLTLTIDEGRHLVGEVERSGIILQTGTQQRSMARFRQACELVRNGRLGKLVSANVWLPAGLRGGPFKTAPIPKGLNWDYWLGQSPKVEYVPERCQRTFRFWYDYSSGTMTDWGAHHNDIAYWAIGQVAPRRVSSRILEQPVPGGYDAFSDYEVNYAYADGTKLIIRTTKDDSIYGEKLKKDGQRNGIRFEGTSGWIWVNREQLQASEPEMLKTPLPAVAIRLYESRNHMENFFNCVRSRKAPICDAETGHRSATMCHLGAISMRTGHALEWDAQAERFVGEFAGEANAYIKREMRAPYDYSFVA